MRISRPNASLKDKLADYVDDFLEIRNGFYEEGVSTFTSDELIEGLFGVLKQEGFKLERINGENSK